MAESDSSPAGLPWRTIAVGASALFCALVLGEVTIDALRGSRAVVERDAVRSAELVAVRVADAVQTFAEGGDTERLEVFLELVTGHQDDLRARAIRAPSVVAEYGQRPAGDPGLATRLERRVLASGVAEHIVDWDDQSVVSALPMVASDRCLGCHDVPVGATLGVVSAEVSMASSAASMDGLSKAVVTIFGGVLAFFVMLVVLGVLVRRLHSELRVGHVRHQALATALVESQAAREAKSQFLATMSHEMRTPMNGVMGLADALSATSLDEEQRRTLALLRSSADTMLRLVDDVLDLSKVEAGRLELEAYPLAFDRLLEECAGVFEPKANAKGVVLSVEIPDGLRGSGLVGDPVRLRQVVSNLVGNAVKFTQTGSVTLSAAVEQVEAGPPERSHVLVEVTDTGVGIPADRRERLFQLFSQVDASTTRRFGGTGLGLAISRRLVEAMGGELGVASEEGVGSCFWFRVPLQGRATGAEGTACQPAGAADAPTDLPAPGDGDGPSAAAGASPSPSASPSPATAPVDSGPADADGPAPLRVLVVEDNRVNQIVARKALERHGHTPVVVADGARALAAVDESAFDAVLMDMQMPVMDGLEATRGIRALDDAARASVPIIGLTANALPSDRQACLDAGMDAYMAKPFKAAELDRVLVATVDARRRGRPAHAEPGDSASPPERATA